MRGQVRSSVAPILFIVLAITAFAVGDQAKADPLKAPSDPIAHRAEAVTPVANESIGPSSLGVRFLFGFYQHGVSPTKGTACPMFPSCSEYGRLSVARHGLFLGIMITADRLHRCGHDLYLYERLWSVSHGWCYDDAPH
jgi:Putative membrane protein insertion efficiency factor